MALRAGASSVGSSGSHAETGRRDGIVCTTKGVIDTVGVVQVVSVVMIKDETKG